MRPNGSSLNNIHIPSINILSANSRITPALTLVILSNILSDATSWDINREILISNTHTKIPTKNIRVTKNLSENVSIGISDPNITGPKDIHHR